jgi:hypothetical protein
MNHSPKEHRDSTMDVEITSTMKAIQELYGNEVLAQLQNFNTLPKFSQKNSCARSGTNPELSRKK